MPPPARLFHLEPLILSQNSSGKYWSSIWPAFLLTRGSYGWLDLYGSQAVGRLERAAGKSRQGSGTAPIGTAQRMSYNTIVSTFLEMAHEFSWFVE